MTIKKFITFFRERSKDLSLAERAIYLELLVHQMNNGAIPFNGKRMAMIVGVTDKEIEDAWYIIRSKFAVDKKRGVVEDIEFTKLCKPTKRTRATKIVLPGSLQEVVEYFDENDCTEESAKLFYDGYSKADWKDSTGKPILNWKQKATHVWFCNPRNKKQQLNGIKIDMSER